MRTDGTENWWNLSKGNVVLSASQLGLTTSLRENLALRPLKPFSSLPSYAFKHTAQLSVLFVSLHHRYRIYLAHAESFSVSLSTASGTIPVFQGSD